MNLSLSFNHIKDPDGYQDSLRLKGNWLIVCLSDGKYIGYGEASHSGNDKVCEQKIRNLFNSHLQCFTPSIRSIQQLETTTYTTAEDFITATAISSLNQALYDLLAKQNKIPVWKLFNPKPTRKSTPYYATINRALRTRTKSDYRNICQEALDCEISRIKCAPFEKILPEMSKSDQIKASQEGLSILQTIHEEFPDLSIRVDFHNRFHLQAFLQILPQLEALDLDWIEEPCCDNSDFQTIRENTCIPLAAGELYYGTEKFIRLMDDQLVDIIMPDVKHVGGFGPLLEVCKEAKKRGIQVSPHNPSGRVAGLATLHAAVVTQSISIIETTLLSTGGISLAKQNFRFSTLTIPRSPGWGLHDYP